MKNIYLIYYCNGEDHEGYDKYPILAFVGERKAQKVLAELTEWHEEARGGFMRINRSDWETQERAISRYIKSLKPPYDLTCLIENIEYREHASLSVNTLPLIK